MLYSNIWDYAFSEETPPFSTVSSSMLSGGVLVRAEGVGRGESLMRRREIWEAMSS